MKKTIIVLSLVLAVFIPNVSYSQEKETKALKDAEKRETSDIKSSLTDRTKTLSILREDLKRIYTSMNSGQAKERFAIIHCRENIANIEGIYRYAADGLDGLFLIKRNNRSYYGYLNEYGFEQMRRLQDEYLRNIQKMYSQISTETALGVIDKAIETIGSSSRLLDETIAIIQEHSKQAGEETERI